MRFAIFTHVAHIKRKGQFYAYAPYVREMNLWLKQVEEVEVVAPFINGSQTSTAEPYRHDRIEITAVPAFDLLSLKSSLRAFFLFPLICTRILAAMNRADHLHLRCPGNVGLIACFCQIFFPTKPKTAKYAGNWDPQAKQPWTYRLQKWILSNTLLTRNMQVLVYGELPGKTKNIVPFFTASFLEEEKAEVLKKVLSEPFTFLFVGNLVEGKRPLEAVKLVEAINAEVVQNRAPKIRASLKIYGDGPERLKLETYVREKQLHQYIIFKGSRPLEELKDAYKKAHFVILPSKSEGWPKAIAEAMFFGCIPIATPISCVPWMLGGGCRGILLDENQETRSKNQDRKNEWSEYGGLDVEKIIKLLVDQGEMKRMSKEAKEWSQYYTLEKFEAAIQEVLNKEPQTTNHKQKCASSN
ncbi:glycosyltransferase family 4 protein [Salinimicrobium sp. CAU 1759]